MDERTRSKMQALASEYANHLPEKMVHLTASWQALQSAWELEALETFYRELHVLSGSAAIYGFESVSKAARMLELYVHDLCDRKADYSTSIQFDIDVMFRAFDHVTAKPERSFADLVLLGSTVTSTLGVKRFYVLDRDPVLIEALRVTLAKEPVEVKVMSDFNAFREAITDRLEDAVIIINIDDLSKADIQKMVKIRQNQEAVVPLIAVSANADLATRIKSVRLYATVFLQKPVDMPWLVKALLALTDVTPGAANRVLIIDDTASLAEYYALVLHQAGLCAHVITNPLNLMDAIADFQPDILLMDIYMPACNGLELAKVLRQEPLYEELPIIFLTSEDERLKPLFAMGMKHIDDFLMKPVLPAHLVAAVRYRAKRQGGPLLMRDSLTQLLNQPMIQENLHAELTASQHYQRPLSFLFVDLDHFQLVNERYGRAIGDYVIRKASEFLLSQVRKVDMVGRYNGEKFAIILPGADVDASRRIGEKLRDKFADLRFMADGAEFSVTFCVGVASYPPIHSARDLIAAADRALRRAKSDGRNGVLHAEDMET